MSKVNSQAEHQIYHERLSLLKKIETHVEAPMLFLSFVWLILMILEFTVGLSSFLMKLNNLIWFLFIIDFSIQFILAPEKIKYLKRSWLTAAALFLPALRLFRVFRSIQVLKISSSLRTLRLARVLTSLNRGMNALGKTLKRRGFGYVLGLTIIVLLAGAAGILSFEKENEAITNYGTAVWWTAMILTTMGSDYFPRTSEGRLLCLLLAVYGFAVFGYVTAAVATFFVGRDAHAEDAEIAGQKSVEELSIKITELQKQIADLATKITRDTSKP